jgi:four helix bundle protein
MLRIYPVAVALVRRVHPLVKDIARHDAGLAEQCRRALSSGPLNISEGSYSQGKNRPARYYNAMGSMREALSCLELAAALGYIGPLEASVVAQFNHVIGTLVRNVRP